MLVVSGAAKILARMGQWSGALFDKHPHGQDVSVHHTASGPACGHSMLNKVACAALWYMAGATSHWAKHLRASVILQAWELQQASIPAYR